MSRAEIDDQWQMIAGVRVVRRHARDGEVCRTIGRWPQQQAMVDQLPTPVAVERRLENGRATVQRLLPSVDVTQPLLRKSERRKRPILGEPGAGPRQHVPPSRCVPEQIELVCDIGDAAVQRGNFGTQPRGRVEVTGNEEIRQLANLMVYGFVFEQAHQLTLRHAEVTLHLRPHVQMK